LVCVPGVLHFEATSLLITLVALRQPRQRSPESSLSSEQPYKRMSFFTRKICQRIFRLFDLNAGH
jgi:hypothetical protein